MAMDEFDTQEEYENRRDFGIPQSEIDSALSNFRNQLISEPFKYDKWNAVDGVKYLAGIYECREQGGPQYLRTLANVYYETNPSLYIIRAFLARRDEFSRIWESGEHLEKNTPQYFVEWAISKNLPLPWLDMAIEQGLLHAPAANGKQAKHLQLMPELDPSSPTYPPELDAAIRAWIAVSAIEAKGKPKTRIRAWLDSNTEFSNEAKERISILVNWDKKGGATSSD